MAMALFFLVFLTGLVVASMLGWVTDSREGSGWRTEGRPRGLERRFP